MKDEIDSGIGFADPFKKLITMDFFPEYLFGGIQVFFFFSEIVDEDDIGDPLVVQLPDQAAAYESGCAGDDDHDQLNLLIRSITNIT
jgi:hypothetical protein